MVTSSGSHSRKVGESQTQASGLHLWAITKLRSENVLQRVVTCPYGMVARVHSVPGFLSLRPPGLSSHTCAAARVPNVLSRALSLWECVCFEINGDY